MYQTISEDKVKFDREDTRWCVTSGGSPEMVNEAGTNAIVPNRPGLRWSYPSEVETAAKWIEDDGLEN